MGFDVSNRTTMGTNATVGMQTNPTANTVLATTPSLAPGAVTGANYEISVLITTSVTTGFFFQALDTQDQIVANFYLLIPANDTKLFNITRGAFFPNGYKFRVINESTLALGAKVQAVIFYKATDLM